MATVWRDARDAQASALRIPAFAGMTGQCQQRLAAGRCGNDDHAFVHRREDSRELRPDHPDNRDDDQRDNGNNERVFEDGLSKLTAA